MEDTLRDKNYCHLRIWHHVLILVLMEDTLRVLIKKRNLYVKSLNPCFNGRYAQSSALSDCWFTYNTS